MSAISNLINCTGIPIDIYSGEYREGKYETTLLGTIPKTEYIANSVISVMPNWDDKEDKSISLGDKKITVITPDFPSDFLRKRVFGLPWGEDESEGNGMDRSLSFRERYKTNMFGFRNEGVTDPDDPPILVTQEIGSILLELTVQGEGQWNGDVYVPDYGGGAITDEEGYFIGTTRLIKYLEKGTAARKHRENLQASWNHWVESCMKRGRDPFD